MKKTLLLFTVALLVSSCTLANKDTISRHLIKIDGYYVVRVEFKDDYTGHDMILYRSTLDVSGVVHSPECMKCKEMNNINN